MQADIARVLISQDRIARRVKELAAQITADYAKRDSHGSGITIVPVMTGALVFCGDLMRQMPIAMKIGLILVSSYPGASVKAQDTQVLSQRLGDLRGRTVLLIDDILDSGGTIKRVVPILKDLGAATVRTCVLLRKDREAAKSVAVDYVGFDIADEFVVGYGLDFNDYYRNLPDIVTLTAEAMEQAAGSESRSSP